MHGFQKQYKKAKLNFPMISTKLDRNIGRMIHYIEFHERIKLKKAGENKRPKVLFIN